jgi:hypothetical protein
MCGTPTTTVTSPLLALAAEMPARSRIPRKCRRLVPCLYAPPAQPCIHKSPYALAAPLDVSHSHTSHVKLCLSPQSVSLSINAYQRLCKTPIACVFVELVVPSCAPFVPAVSPATALSKTRRVCREQPNDPNSSRDSSSADEAHRQKKIHAPEQRIAETTGSALSHAPA